MSLQNYLYRSFNKEMETIKLWQSKIEHEKKQKQLMTTMETKWQDVLLNESSEGNAFVTFDNLIYCYDDQKSELVRIICMPIRVLVFYNLLHFSFTFLIDRGNSHGKGKCWHF